jgi:hypothetical protein
MDISTEIILLIKLSLMLVYLAPRSLPILVFLAMLMDACNVILQSNNYHFLMEPAITVQPFMKEA